MELVDIESLFGPNWAEQRKDLCNFLGNDSDSCTKLKEIPLGPIAGGDIRGYSEIGVQQLMHIAQLVLTNRFQTYQDTFLIEKLFGVKGKIIDVGRIDEPPVKFLYIDGDLTCPVSVQKEYAEKIPAT